GARNDRNDAFGNFETWRAGISWRPAMLAGTRLRATAGTAFREPTFTENYSSGFTNGNPSLQPERTRSADAGIEQDLLDGRAAIARSEEHTSELQSQSNLVCRLLLEKKNTAP